MLLRLNLDSVWWYLCETLTWGRKGSRFVFYATWKMMVEERKIDGGSLGCSALVPCGNGAALNGYTFGSEGLNTDVSFGDYSDEGLRTYKRRKHLRLTAGTNLQEYGRFPSDAASQADQSVMKSKDIILHRNSYELDGCSRVDIPVLLDGSDDCSNGHWRNIVLELILQSMSELGHFHENSLKTESQLNEDSKVPDRSQSVCKEHENATSNGSQNEANDQADVHHVTELCQHVLHNVMVSEKFDLLCKLLCENFQIQEIKLANFLDFSVMNSRMKDGAYEQSPVLFSTDLQQVWHKIQKIGNEMVILSKGLSDISKNSYSALVGGSIHGAYEEGKNEEINHVGDEQNAEKRFSVPESDHETKLEQADVRGTGKINNCRQCGVKADGKDRLVCDSCEEMYHVSCIEPALEEIPSRSWYCANCTASGVESPHENCVVCERLNDARTHTNGSGETLPMEEDMLSDLEESSDCSMKAEDGLQLSNRNRRLRYCKLCGIGEEDNRRLRICGHPQCPNKYYHLRCLTTEQLKSFGPRWYCPSCLCRACLTDQDDEKIVLCDGCDHAYHIYCMEPPCTSIPSGKWFCSQCDVGIQAIHKAKRAYENYLEKHQRKKLGGSNEAVGSVDMLLNAAEKLKCEEKLAATRKKR
ncbi:PHD finger protein EHD3 isoform X2 [Macadamia integrifolia]|uniref:PHD finger protein EHD3 isoform X2 n=1 Tax=Macadamia integrifolia TaxID=60698 RepID=UPI001C4FF1B0|nr:PHD finger protein EHD3 isoform X2 [Macadamia integrifolia]